MVGHGSGSSLEYINPDWDAGGKVHNWRRHVSYGVKEIWHTFTTEQKRVLYEQADGLASLEHWE